MKSINKMTLTERKKEFEIYLKKNVKEKSAIRYISDLERGFRQAPIEKYNSIFEITDPEILENITKQLRDTSVFTRKSSGGTAALAGLNKYISFLKDSRDSYYDFLRHFGIKRKEFFEWGMKAIIFPPIEKVDDEWEKLKMRISNNQEVHIRGYGRDAKGTNLYIKLYEYLFNNFKVKKDSNNNSQPQKIIKSMTELNRNKDIYNYQVSHIWGHTKNIYLFEAPWNICYTPKIIDPLTGHESKGDLPVEFKNHFIRFAQKKYKEYIEDYNDIISKLDIICRLEEYCEKYKIDNPKFVEDATNELSPILFI